MKKPKREQRSMTAGSVATQATLPMPMLDQGEADRRAERQHPRHQRATRRPADADALEAITLDADALDAITLDADAMEAIEVDDVFCGTADPLDGYNTSQRFAADMNGSRIWSLSIPSCSSYAWLTYEGVACTVKVDAAACSTFKRFVNTLTTLVAEHAAGNMNRCAMGEGVYLLTMMVVPDLMQGQTKPSRDKIVSRIRKRVPVKDRQDNVREALEHWAESVAKGKPKPRRKNR